MFEKPHSRENYDKLETKTKEAEETANKNHGHTTMEDFGGMAGDPRKAVFHPSVEQKRYEKLSEKLERMKNAGHKEALGLERKHNELLKKVEGAKQELASFEEEQLGMKEEE